MKAELTLDAVENEIRLMVSGQLRIDENRVLPDAELIDDLGADSLDIVELLIKVENVFGVYVPDDDIADLKTPADAANYIYAALSVEEIPAVKAFNY